LLGITPISGRVNGVVTYEKMLTQAKSLVTDTKNQFIYVHASVPHGPDIFDRTADSLTYLNTSKVGYFDNLVLADRFMGEIKSAMKKAGLWETATVLITSDHEWRHVRLYDGKRLRKLPYLLKMPNPLCQDSCTPPLREF
jgi:hypothetical protein